MWKCSSSTRSTPLPTPPFTAADKEAVAAHVYQHVWQQALRGDAARAT